MTWMETIRVSFGNRCPSELLAVLEGQLDSVESLEWATYANPSVSEDVLIVLRWQGEPAESSTGLAVARELRRHGLVDHAVWQPQTHLGNNGQPTSMRLKSASPTP